MKALYRGPAHVIVAVGDAMTEHTSPIGGLIGRPAREVFDRPEWREAQHVMDLVYRDGRPRAVDVGDLDGLPGRTVVIPAPGGVATHWRPTTEARPLVPRPRVEAGR